MLTPFQCDCCNPIYRISWSWSRLLSLTKITVTQFTDWPTVSLEIWRRSSGPRSNPSYCRTGLPPSSRAGAARQKISKRCDGHERCGNLKPLVCPSMTSCLFRWLNVPPCKYHPRFFPPTTQGLPSPLLYLLYWFNVRNRELSFYLGFAIPFTCALFVDSHPSGGVSSSTPSLHSGSILLTFRIHFPPSCCYFWFESPLPIITVSFESQSSPPSHCYIMQSFLLVKPLQRTAVSLIVSSSPTRLPCRATPALFPSWLAVYSSPSPERISTSLLHPVLTVLPSRPISLSSLCSSVSPRNLIKSRQNRKVSRSL